MIFAPIIAGAAMAVLPFLRGSMIWAAVILAGLPLTGYLGLMVTVSTETEGVGAAAGASMGLVLTVMRLGGIISPPVGNSLAAINNSFAWSASNFNGFS